MPYWRHECKRFSIYQPAAPQSTSYIKCLQVLIKPPLLHKVLSFFTNEAELWIKLHHMIFTFQRHLVAIYCFTKQDCNIQQSAKQYIVYNQTNIPIFCIMLNKQSHNILYNLIFFVYTETIFLINIDRFIMSICVCLLCFFVFGKVRKRKAWKAR